MGGKWIGFGFAAFLVLACNDRDDEAFGSFSELARAFAELTCDSRAVCCERGELPFDPAACRAEVTAQLEGIAAESESDGLAYDAALGRACYDLAKDRVVCGELDDSGGALEDCEGMFRGRVRPGMACSTGDDCARGPGQRASCDDVCEVRDLVPVRRGKQGDACSSYCGSDQCTTTDPNDVACRRSDGLVCAAGVCITLPAIGDPCVDRVYCEVGAYCDVEGTCRAALPNGSDCADLGPDACESGICNFYSGVCQQEPFIYEPDCSSD